jgi:predicted metalloprotease
MSRRSRRTRVRDVVAALVIAAAIGSACTDSQRATPSSSTTPADASTTARTKNTSTIPASSVAPTRAPRPAQSYDALLRTTIADLEQWWSTELPDEYGTAYKKLRGGVFAYRSTSTVPQCGFQRLPYRVIANNAFFCPESDFVAWDDEQLFPELRDEYGEFLLAVVLAHEWGHAIQERLDLLWLETIVTEQQADCFAGAWAGHLDPITHPELASLRDAELDRSLAGFVEFRDLVGFDTLIAGSHGTAFDRIRAFQDGFTGGVSRCATYEDDAPDLVGFSYRNLKEFWTGGDEPFDDAITINVESLRSNESAAALVADRPRECGSGSTFATALRGVMTMCRADEPQAVWNRNGLRAYYDDFGDFAVGTVMAIGAMSAAIDSESATPTGVDTGSTPLSPVERENLAVCRAGAWAGSLVDLDDPTKSVLSPGDLDEGVQTILRLAVADDVAVDPGELSTGFRLVDAYRRGVLDGTCDDLPQP